MSDVAEANSYFMKMHESVGPAPFDKLKAFPDHDASGHEPVERLAAGPARCAHDNRNGLPTRQPYTQTISKK